MVDRAKQRENTLSGSRGGSRSSLAGAGRRSRPCGLPVSMSRWYRVSRVRLPFLHRSVSRSRTGNMPRRLRSLPVTRTRPSPNRHLTGNCLHRDAGTIVILMGVANLKNIARALIANGKSGETPVAIIERGLRKDRRVTTGPLTTIGDIAARAGVKPPGSHRDRRRGPALRSHGNPTLFRTKVNDAGIYQPF